MVICLRCSRKFCTNQAIGLDYFQGLFWFYKSYVITFYLFLDFLLETPRGPLQLGYLCKENLHLRNLELLSVLGAQPNSTKISETHICSFKQCGLGIKLYDNMDICAFAWCTDGKQNEKMESFQKSPGFRIILVAASRNLLPSGIYRLSRLP